MRSLIRALAIAAIAATPLSAQIAANWIESPEAYFATPIERVEWTRLTTDADRA